MIRGGNWNNNPSNCRSSNRNANHPTNRNNNIGFRVVLVAESVRVNRQYHARCARARICVDPGIGFGKTAEHNLSLMQATGQIRKTLGRPILVGHSRKRFLSKLLDRAVEERNAGTTGVSIALAQNGVDMLRVHDVNTARDALTAWDAVRGKQSS